MRGKSIFSLFPQPITADKIDMRLKILEIIENIEPIDALEQEHLTNISEWIKSETPIFRLQKPDTPPQHLVSYCVILDTEEEKILLVDHKKAQLWLPTGGHVEVDEHPRDTALRECQEELNWQGTLYQGHPLFATITTTVGLTAEHTDVSLWYIMKGNSQDFYNFNKSEFYRIRWFNFHELPFERSDPHLKRFVTKLKTSMKTIKRH